MQRIRPFIQSAARLQITLTEEKRGGEQTARRAPSSVAKAASDSAMASGRRARCKSDFARPPSPSATVADNSRRSCSTMSFHTVVLFWRHHGSASQEAQLSFAACCIDMGPGLPHAHHPKGWLAA